MQVHQHTQLYKRLKNGPKKETSSDFAVAARKASGRACALKKSPHPPTGAEPLPRKGERSA